MIGANILFAFNDVWSRRIADDIGLVQAIWGRSVLFLGLIALTMNTAQWRETFVTRRPQLQIVRGIFPVIGAFLMIGAMGRIPAADATATFFMCPIFAVLLAIPLLREHIGLATWTAVVLGITGTLVIVQPGGSAFDRAYLWALLTAVIIALYQIFTSLVSRTDSPRTTLFFMAFTAAAITSCIVPFTWQTPSLEVWLYLLGSSLLYAIGHGMYIAAHVHEEASKLAPLLYFQLLGSIAAGFFFYGQVPSPNTMLGAVLIAAGGCIVLLHRSANLLKRTNRIILK
jgi:drug/metabolite transporter (DMT)-like permease